MFIFEFHNHQTAERNFTHIIMQEKTDKRIKRTKYLLLHALTTLMKEKSIKNISVKELCESVDINRGTFYLHYKDIYDLLEKTEQELLTQMEAIFQKYTPDSPDFPCSLFTELFCLIHKNADFFRVLLSSNGDISFVIKIKELFDRQCIQKWGYFRYPQKQCQSMNISAVLPFSAAWDSLTAGSQTKTPIRRSRWHSCLQICYQTALPLPYNK